MTATDVWMLQQMDALWVIEIKGQSFKHQLFYLTYVISGHYRPFQLTGKCLFTFASCPQNSTNSLNTLMCLAAKTTYAVIRGVIAARAETPLVQLAWVPLEGCSAVWSLVRNSCLSMYSSFLGRSLQFILNSQRHSVLLLLPKLVYSILVQICLFLLKSWLLPLWTCTWKQGCTKPSFWKCSSKIREVCVVETAGKGRSLPTERAKNRGRSASAGTAASPMLWGAQRLAGCPC